MPRTTDSLSPRVRGRAGEVGVGPAVLVAADALELRVELLDRCHAGVLPVEVDVAGCVVVPERAACRDAGRWWCRRRRRGRWSPAAGRGVPSSRAKTSVSASHSCGNSAATWATGQWCWQSWSPARRGADRRGVAVAGERLGEDVGAVLGLGGVDQGAVAVLELGGAAAGELGHGLGAAGVAQEAQRAGGEVVVGLDERVAPGVGEHEDLGRPAAPAGAVARAARAPRGRPSATRWSRWRRTAAGVRDSRSASAAAVEGPFSRIERATRSRVGASSSAARRRRRRRARLHVFHNTIVS